MEYNAKLSTDNSYLVFLFDGTTIGIALLSLQSDDRYRTEVRSVVIANRPILAMLLVTLRSLNNASLPSIAMCSKAQHKHIPTV